jgi:hypothetical protein
VLLIGSGSAAAAPILRGFDLTYFGTDSESWVEEILGVDVFMIAEVSSSEGELTGLGDWEFVSFRPDANPFDDIFNLGEWSYSGNEQVAYYSIDNLLSISVWEPDPANAGQINWLAPDHLTLWGIASSAPSSDEGPDSSSVPVPEPSAALLFALGSMLSMVRVRRLRAAT